MADWLSPDSVHSVCGTTGGSASNIVDGDTGTYWAHYVNEHHQIILDLGQLYEVSKVRLYRKTSVTDQLQNIDVYISESAEDWGEAVKENWDLGPTNNRWYETSVGPKVGRYIILDDFTSLDSTNRVSTREFQFQGEPSGEGPTPYAFIM